MISRASISVIDRVRAILVKHPGRYEPADMVDKHLAEYGIAITAIEAVGAMRALEGKDGIARDKRVWGVER